MLTSFNGFLRATMAKDLLTLTARGLSLPRPIHFSLDAAALTPAIALLLQHLLSIAYRTATARLDPPKADFTIFKSIQWQVHSVSPRLPWRWLTVIIIAFRLATSRMD